MSTSFDIRFVATLDHTNAVFTKKCHFFLAIATVDFKFGVTNLSLNLITVNLKIGVVGIL